MCWMGGATHEEMSRIYVAGAASAGYDVIATPYWQTYLGKSQGLKGDSACYRGKEVVTLEMCHAFDPAEGVSSTNRQRVLGGEACNWTESTRGEAELFGKMWPRTAALAEALALALLADALPDEQPASMAAPAIAATPPNSTKLRLDSFPSFMDSPFLAIPRWRKHAAKTVLRQAFSLFSILLDVCMV